MLGNGILAKDLHFKILNAKKPGELILAIEQFLEGAKTENLSIHDISFVPKGDETLVVFFFTQPK